MRSHWREVHQWSLADGRPGGGNPARRREIAKKRVEPQTPVHCQRLFRANAHSAYFEVLPGDSERHDEQAAISHCPVTNVLDEVLGLEKERDSQRVVRDAAGAKQVSPWLELTQWTECLDGHPLLEVAALAGLPRAETEPLVAAMCESMDRTVEMAYRSVCDKPINAFDQVRINSFLQRPRATDRPLMVKLQKPTYRQYRNIFKRLLAFTYRTAQPGQQIRLRHRLSSAQVACLDRCVARVEGLLRLKRAATLSESTPLELDHAIAAVDRSCLDLCISLFDHDLKGDLFESAVVGFFAALAIDEEKRVFREAYQYTSFLSGFVKIAQLVVIQKAVTAADGGEIVYPVDLQARMRDRFLVHGTRSPFNWASRLRMYGKKIRDTTTCLGHILWSDDKERVSYKKVRELRMDDFRDFVRKQLAAAQSQLEDLLLLHPEETREDLGVEFWMHQVVDDAAENRDGWNFLQLHQNREGPLPVRDTWVLQRVLRNEWLRDEFLVPSRGKSTVCKLDAVQAYGAKVEAFLERLLLLVHLTSGQPARGTEILRLRYVNTLQGHHRNIFIENGMVSTVTAYHKGYSITGSTKIIHRDLPKEVGELLIYYLWLVLPFRLKLELLAYRRQEEPSPFLWPKANTKGDEPWNSARLSHVLKREFKTISGCRSAPPRTGTLQLRCLASISHVVGSSVTTALKTLSLTNNRATVHGRRDRSTLEGSMKRRGT